VLNYFFVALEAILLLNCYTLLYILEINDFSVEGSDLIEYLELSAHVSKEIKEGKSCIFVNKITIKAAHSRAVPSYGTPRMQHSLRL